jgi:hypothetical protein
MNGPLAMEWISFVGKLHSSHVCLQEDMEKKLCWDKNLALRSFTSKLGYKAQAEVVLLGQKIWWWERSWKLHAPLKAKIVLWLALNNKFLTWDIELKRG